MDKQFVKPSVENPQVLLDGIHGNVRVKGSDELEIVVKSSTSEGATLEQQGEVYVIRSQEDCSLRLPLQAMLKTVNGHGNMTIKAVEGKISIENLDGNLELRSVGPTAAQRLHGNVEAKNILGDFEIDQVDGNLTARDVQGQVSLKNVGGNLVLGDVDGSIEAKASGNVVLRLDPAPGQEYAIDAEGNLNLTLPGDSSAEIHITRGNKIVINLPGVTSGRDLRAPYDLTLGEGDAKLTLSAGANVFIGQQISGWDVMPDMSFEIGKEFEGTAEAIAEQVTQQIEAQMEMLEHQLSTHLDNLSTTLGSYGLSEEQIARIQQRAQESSERATARAQEKMRRAQERIERKMAYAQQRMEQKARMAEQRARAAGHRAHRHGEHPWGVPWTEGVQPPGAPVQEPVSDEERLVILRMLEEKKITLDEAEQLLSALEGKG